MSKKKKKLRKEFQIRKNKTVNNEFELLTDEDEENVFNFK